MSTLKMRASMPHICRQTGGTYIQPIPCSNIGGVREVSVPVQHDWDRIRAEYVAGKCSYAQLAQEHGMLKSQLGKRARAEDWPAQREAYRKRVADAAIRKRRYKDTEQLEGLISAGEKMVVVLQRVMQDDHQFNRYVDTAYEKDATGQLHHVKTDYVSDKVDTKALANATRALSEMTRVMRNLYGLPTKMELEKLELEKRKVKMQEQKQQMDTGVGGDTGVVLMPERKPESQDALEVE